MTPARIQRLAPLLIGQIAAGEVVERPASVVKELLENSLDAGASRIEVEIEQGGSKLIRVRDNGGGIHPADLGLALTRHATSKINDLSSLARVRSLGFRGEALPSIAAVSRLLLTSRAAGETQGWQLAGDEAAARPVAHPPGTTVEVRDLFYNVPARRKFLRSERTEYGQLEDVVRRLALSRDAVAFHLSHNQRLLLRLPVATTAALRQQRLAELCGPLFAANAVELTGDDEGELGLSGWLGLPAVARSQADLQYLYINGRPVRDRLLTHAVRQAYQDVLYHDTEYSMIVDGLKGFG
jgi:DNA mismatch repair protein MutL